MHINGGDTMLTLTPVALATANAFVNAHHRHHKANIDRILELDKEQEEANERREQEAEQR